MIPRKVPAWLLDLWIQEVGDQSFRAYVEFTRLYSVRSFPKLNKIVRW